MQAEGSTENGEGGNPFADEDQAGPIQTHGFDPFAREVRGM